jgi:D-alanyl-lipoteichoic acid acyltransferase DltB (MBOAT superfamily)
LIVTGLARLLGYVLPLNFRQPYLARNLQDFWTRWHISLSSFIRDYIYIPMGGNQRGFARTQWHVLAGMLISGVWHGPSWTFVIWGALHGLGVVTFNIYKRAQCPQWPTFWAQALTFMFVTLAWVFFRADTGAGALTLLQGLMHNPLGFWPEDLSRFATLFAFTVLYFLLCSHAKWWESRVVGWMASVPAAEVTFMLMVLCYGLIAWGPSGVPGFIYYRF